MDREAEAQAAQWSLLGASVRGAAHIRADLPNQDAIAWLPTSGGPDARVVMALSDGHGSAKYFRSASGAQLAVSTAADTLLSLIASQDVMSTNLSATKRTAEEKLPQTLVRAWEEAVHAHLAEHPFTEEERQRLAEQSGAEAVARLDSAPLRAYGATLLAVVVMPDYILYIQLGDGDMLTVSAAGEVARPPLAVDARLFGDETTSLCTPDAWRDFRVYFQTLAGEPPALLLLSTDGYSKSFRDESGFFAVGSDLLEMARADGLEAIGQSLPDWLAEASQRGSGDDITLGLIYRVGV